MSSANLADFDISIRIAKTFSLKSCVLWEVRSSLKFFFPHCKRWMWQIPTFRQTEGQKSQTLKKRFRHDIMHEFASFKKQCEEAHHYLIFLKGNQNFHFSLERLKGEGLWKLSFQHLVFECAIHHCLHSTVIFLRKSTLLRWEGQKCLSGNF